MTRTNEEKKEHISTLRYYPAETTAPSSCLLARKTELHKVSKSKRKVKVTAARSKCVSFTSNILSL